MCPPPVARAPPSETWARARCAHRTSFVAISWNFQDIPRYRYDPDATAFRMELAMRVLIALILAAVFTAAGARPVASPVGADSDSARGWSDYRHGRHTSALTHYRKAAEKHHRVAQFNLAVMLIEGIGTRPRPGEGVAWLRRSAQSGFAQAQYALAELYDRGEHVPRSPATATAWYRAAAEQGSRDAQVGLATQYFLGRGAPQDHAEAARWYELAAAQGDAGACYIIASMYERGYGVAPDPERAMYWYAQAAARGEAGAAAQAHAIRQRLDAI